MRNKAAVLKGPGAAAQGLFIDFGVIFDIGRNEFSKNIYLSNGVMAQYV